MAKSPITFYEGFLRSLGMVVGADNTISYQGADGDLIPMTIESKRLVMPTQEMLRTIDSKFHVAFHPLCEMIMRNESPVQRKIRTVINTHTTGIVIQLLITLAALAISDQKDKTARSEYFELFTLMNGAKESTFKAVEKLVEVIEVTGTNNRLINFGVKRSGELGGKKYRRSCQVTFPILAEWEANKPEDRIFGVKMSKKDKTIIFSLLNFIIRGLKVPDAYSAGSDSMIAPTFMAVANAYAAFMTDINTVVWTFKDELPNVGIMQADLSWIDLAQDLDQYNGFLPVLEGNEGVASVQAANGATANIGTVSKVTSPLTTAPNIAAITTPTIIPTQVNPSPGGFGGFPTVKTGQQNSGFLHPKGTVGFNPMGGNPMMMNMFNPMMSMMNYAPPGANLMSVIQQNQPQVNPMMMQQGIVMSADGQQLNIWTAPLAELEKALDSTTYGFIYAQRLAQEGMKRSMYNQMPGANGFAGFPVV